jgi:hypothetical protein
MTTPTQLVEIVAQALAPIGQDLVFVGGAITGFLLTDPIAPAPSSTKDVDVIVSVTTAFEYLDDLSQRMRAAGFREDTDEDAPICRWRLRDGIKLDLMPTDPRVLGFANRWFPEAFETAQPHRLTTGLTIRIVTAPMFLATKLEAFGSRGNHDYAASKDIEDIVAVIHGREETVAEAGQASAEVRRYLAEQAAALLVNPAFAEALAGHLPGEDITRVPRRLARLADLD